MIPNQSAPSAERVLSELRDLEHIVWNIVLRSKAFPASGYEAKPRVIFRMPEHNDDVMAKALAVLQTFPN